MDYITEESPKRLIALDLVEQIARDEFGDKYEYTASVSAHDPLEKIKKIEKPIWNTILGEEGSALFDVKGTIENEVAVTVHITAPVQSNKLVHAMPFLNDIEILKRSLIGKEIEHKGNFVYGHCKNKNMPNTSSHHEIDFAFTTPILSVWFCIILQIYDDGGLP